MASKLEKYGIEILWIQKIDILCKDFNIYFKKATHKQITLMKDYTHFVYSIFLYE